MLFSSCRTLPGQGARHQGLHGRLADLGWRRTIGIAKAIQEMRDQGGDVLFSIAQGWQANTDHVEPVIQVFTEGSVRDIRFQIAVGRGQHAHIRLDGCTAAYAFKGAELQHTQKFLLRAHTQLADLIQEDRGPYSPIRSGLCAVPRLR